jgi:glycosyltransferase involved in cell wall biosynthesis
MKVNFVSFLDPRVYQGGGEMISRRLLEAGEALGHDIRLATVRPQRRDLHRSPDVSLLIDVFNFAHTFRSLGAWRAFGHGFLEDVMGRAPFAHMSNAYVDVCNMPYLPCSGERASSVCPAKPQHSALRRFAIRDHGVDCFAADGLVRRMFTASALNIFLSPLHRRISEALLGGDLPPAFVLKPLIDTVRFTNLGLVRDIDYLFVGVIGEAKGLKEMRERFAATDIHLIGRLAPGVKLDFGRHLGHLPYDEVPRYMNQARNFVFLPRWPEPQGRVVAEAALCGCNIIGNHKVGALSFGMDLADPANYVGVEDEFWRVLEGIAP